MQKIRTESLYNFLKISNAIRLLLSDNDLNNILIWEWWIYGFCHFCYEVWLHCMCVWFVFFWLLSLLYTISLSFKQDLFTFVYKIRKNQHINYKIQLVILWFLIEKYSRLHLPEKCLHDFQCIMIWFSFMNAVQPWLVVWPKFFFWNFVSFETRQHKWLQVVF
jgi:hypothetical protein